jgi:predicted nucleotidyltransferase
MEFEYKKNEIVFNRELSSLDKLVLKFLNFLDKEKIDYVIISGYIAILFGRSRNTEDVDLFIEKMSFEKFERFWKTLEKNGFECIHVSKPKEAYEEFLLNKTSIRFAEKGKWMPNFELKFPSEELSQYSLQHKVKVILNGQKLNTSKLETQIAYKLYLGSEKDLEDAAHLWSLFKNKLDKTLFNKFVSKLKVEDKIKEIE